MGDVTPPPPPLATDELAAVAASLLEVDAAEVGMAGAGAVEETGTGIDAALVEEVC